MQADLEEQNDHAKLREAVNDRIGRIKEAECRFSEENPRDELADDRRLPESLRSETEKLCGKKQSDKDTQKVRNIVLAHKR